MDRKERRPSRSPRRTREVSTFGSKSKLRRAHFHSQKCILSSLFRLILGYFELALTCMGLRLVVNCYSVVEVSDMSNLCAFLDNSLVGTIRLVFQLPNFISSLLFDSYTLLDQIFLHQMRRYTDKTFVDHIYQIVSFSKVSFRFTNGTTCLPMGESAA